MINERFTIYLSRELCKTLKIHAIRNGKSASAIAGQAIQEFLDRAESESVPAVAESPKPKRRGKGVAA